MAPKNYTRAPPKTTFFGVPTLGWILVDFGVPFWHPFGLLWAPFGALLGPCWSLWASFWNLLAPLWVLSGPFCTLFGSFCISKDEVYFLICPYPCCLRDVWPSQEKKKEEKKITNYKKRRPRLKNFSHRRLEKKDNQY